MRRNATCSLAPGDMNCTTARGPRFNRVGSRTPSRKFNTASPRRNLSPQSRKRGPRIAIRGPLIHSRSWSNRLRVTHRRVFAVLSRSRLLGRTLGLRPQHALFHQLANLGQGLVLDLADALFGNADNLADL